MWNIDLHINFFKRVIEKQRNFSSTEYYKMLRELQILGIGQND